MDIDREKLWQEFYAEIGLGFSTDPQVIEAMRHAYYAGLWAGECHQSAEQSVQRIGLWARIKKWFCAIAYH